MTLTLSLALGINGLTGEGVATEHGLDSFVEEVDEVHPLYLLHERRVLREFQIGLAFRSYSSVRRAQNPVTKFRRAFSIETTAVVPGLAIEEIVLGFNRVC